VMKLMVVLLLVLNFLALVFMMPDDNSGAGIISGDQMPASGLALLSEVGVELRRLTAEEVKLTNVAESASDIKELGSNNTLIGREPARPKQSAAVLSTAAKLRSTSLLKEAPAFQCGHVKGIKGIDAANRLKKKMDRLGATNFVIGTSYAVEHKYWVYLGPYRSKQQAIDANDRLRKKKRSGYVFTNNKEQHSISVGVFSSSENAQRLRSELSLAGYRAKIWNQRVSLFVLKADIPSNGSAISALISKEGHVISTCK
jgi:hypothetical protein